MNKKLSELIWLVVGAGIAMTLVLLLVLIHDHAGFIALLNPVAVGVVVLFIVTIGWSRLRPGKKYPNKWW